MTRQLTFFIISLASIIVYTGLLVFTGAWGLTQYATNLSLSILGEGPSFELVGMTFIGALGGLLLSLLLIPTPYKLLMHLAEYLREKRGWGQVQYPRRIFVLALLAFYSPIILLILSVLL